MTTLGENWISVKDRMPKSTQHVLFCWVNRSGNKRVGAGGWTKKFHIQMTEDYEFGEINPADEESYVPEGWSEWGWELEYSATPDGEVTHWMPMPKHPESK